VRCDGAQLLEHILVGLPNLENLLLDVLKRVEHRRKASRKTDFYRSLDLRDLLPDLHRGEQSPNNLH